MQGSPMLVAANLWNTIAARLIVAHLSSKNSRKILQEIAGNVSS